MSLNNGAGVAEFPLTLTSPPLPGLGWSWKWIPEFKVQHAETVTGASIDLSQAQFPLHHFELTYDFLHDPFGDAPSSQSGGSEFKTLLGFWMAMGGTLGRFAFLNPDDYAVTAQAIGVTDGTTTTQYPLGRSIAGETGYAGSSLEPIGLVDTTQSFLLYLNGTLQLGGYTLVDGTPMNQYVIFTTAPPSGQTITVTYSYLYYCRFEENSSTFEKFSNNLWKNGKVNLVSCRLGT